MFTVMYKPAYSLTSFNNTIPSTIMYCSYTCLLSVPLTQWFSKYGPWTSNISITWDLLEREIFGFYARPAESASLGVEPNNLCFKKSLNVIMKHAQV